MLHAAAGFMTDEFIKENALIDGEYTEEHYESTSKGNFSLSEDDENAEMLQTILEGLYSNASIRVNIHPVERHSLLLYLMANETSNRNLQGMYVVSLCSQ